MFFRIIMATGAHPVRRRAIAIFVDVERMFLSRIQSLDMRDDLHLGSFLSEHHLAFALVRARWMQDGHRLLYRTPALRVSVIVFRSGDAKGACGSHGENGYDRCE